jgi:hypothetical protein
MHVDLHAYVAFIDDIIKNVLFLTVIYANITILQHNGMDYIKKIKRVGWPCSLCYMNKLLPRRTLWPIFQIKGNNNVPYNK